jgi:hypothetical protein
MLKLILGFSKLNFDVPQISFVIVPRVFVFAEVSSFIQMVSYYDNTDIYPPIDKVPS